MASSASLRTYVPEAKRLPKRDYLTLLFLYVSLGATMFVPQASGWEIAPLHYYFFLAPAIVIPLLRPLALVEAAQTKALLVVIYFALAATWHITQGDETVVYQVGLICLAYVWHNSKHVVIALPELTTLYALAIVIGIILRVTTDLNEYGLLPGVIAPYQSVWRVSFFPHIAFTGFLSLSLVMVMTRFGWRWALGRPIFIIALYFLIFSFVRAAFIGLVVYALLWMWFKRRPRSPFFLFTVSMSTAIIVNVMITYSGPIFAQLPSISIINRLFLRGETGLSEYELYQQLYRPWLWSEHWNQFLTSPGMMGWGSADFHTLIRTELVVGWKSSDSVSLPTRILAQHGIAAIFFILYLVVCLVERARRGDAWACATFPAVALGMMHWGGIFHPTNVNGFILMLMIVKGTDAFPWPVVKEQDRRLFRAPLVVHVRSS